jgi:hypothetical protein
LNWQVSTPNVVTSLYTGGNVAGSPQAFNVPASGSVTPVSLIDVSQYASYDLAAYIGDPTQGSSGHALCVKIELKWFDDNQSGIPVFIEDWYPWVSSAIPPANAWNGVIATGPMHGRYMTITITNPGNSAVEFAWFNLFGSNRPTQLSDWRQNISGNGSGITDHTFHTALGSAGEGFENVVLETTSLTLSAGLSYVIPCNLYAGPVNYKFVQNNADTPVADILLVDIGTNYQSNTSGSLSNSKYQSGTLVDVGAIAAAAAQPSNFQGSLNLPRSACAVICAGPSAGTSTMTFTIIGQQGP